MKPRPVSDTWPGWFIALHWVIALMLSIMIGVGFVMVAVEETAAATGDFTIKVFGLPLYQAYQLHKSVGLTLFWLIVLRLGLRLTLGLTAPRHDHSRLERFVARTVQIVLYALMLSMPLTGWLMASSSPLGLPTMWFGLVNVPHPLGPDAARKEILATLHALGGYALLAIAGLHAAAALRQHLVDRDGTLTAMLPPLRHLEKRQ